MFKIAWYELKKLFRNTVWVILFILQPIVLVILLSLVAYHDPTGIKVIAYSREDNEYSQHIVDDLRNENDFDLIIVSSEDKLRSDIKTDKAKMAVLIDVKKTNGMIDGKVEAISNATVPEISFISKLKVIKAVQKTTENLAKDNVQSKMNETVAQKRADFENQKNQMYTDLKAKIAGEGLPTQFQDKINNLIDSEQINADFNVGNNTDVPKIEFVDSENTVKDLKYFDLYASALLIMITLMITLKASDTSITEERSTGTFERFFVTPYRKIHMIAGKMIAFTVVNVGIIAILLFTIIVLTHISVGPLWLVFLLCFMTALSSAALGIFISTITYTINESIQVSNLLFFSSLIMTGFLFQPESMNKYVKAVAYCVPFTYSIKAMRQVNLLGMGFYDILPELVIILAFTIGFIIIATLALRRKAT